MNDGENQGGQNPEEGDGQEGDEEVTTFLTTLTTK
jgi:hypothetical protein